MKKKLIVGVAAVLIVALLVGFVGPGGGPGGNGGNGGNSNQGAASGAIRTVTLQLGSIESTISATGAIYSNETSNVYTSLSNEVKLVNAEVGDRVEAGDVLAELDSASIESNLAQKQASLSTSQQSQQQKIETAQYNLSTYQTRLGDNMNSSLISAENSVASAEREVTSAERELSLAWSKYREARNDDEDDDVIKERREAAETKQLALEKAEASLENAKKNLEVAKLEVQEQIHSYETTIKTETTNYNYTKELVEIEQLMEDIENCIITAPISGTITQVDAVVGNKAEGRMFVIQDTEGLMVKTNIKEYDIGTVSIGDRVVIKTDATGDTEYIGKLSSIAPTSTQTAAGDASSSTEAEYAAEVAITSDIKGLLIGMNARLSIITDSRTNVFTVPYEAVENTADGKSFVYAQSTASDGTASYARIPVECGIESSIYVEISGDGLEEGMQIVRTAANIDQSLVTSGQASGTLDASADDAAQPERQGSRPEGAPEGGSGRPEGAMPGGGMPQ